MALVLFVACGLAVMQGTTSTAHASTGITIDGDTSDWDSIAKTTVNSNGNSNQFALAVSGDYVYLYVNEGQSATGNFYDYITLQANGETTYLRTTSSTNLSSSSQNVPLTYDVYNSSTQKDSSTTGYVTEKSGHTIEEAKVPLSALGLSSGSTDVTMIDGQYGLSTAIKATALTADSSSSSTSSSSASSTSSSASSAGSSSSSATGSSTTSSSGSEYTVGSNYGITIDGQFSDWDSYTKTLIKESDDNYNVKQGAMLSDGTYLYIFIEMDYDKGNAYNQLQTSGYKLVIGGVTYDLSVRNTDGTQFTNTMSSIGDTEKLGINIWDEANNSNVNPTDGWSNVAAKDVSAEAGEIKNDSGDATQAMEVKIPLSDLTKSSQDGQTATLTNANLGTQTIKVVSGSTGPVLLAASGFGIALFGLWQFSRNKKRQRRTK